MMEMMRHDVGTEHCCYRGPSEDEFIRNLFGDALGTAHSAQRCRKIRSRVPRSSVANLASGSYRAANSEQRSGSENMRK